MLDEAHIVVEKLGRSFPSPDGTTLQVLEDLSFDVPRGGLVSIVGPSGCGKSTLLNLVAGIDTPTMGEVRTDGAVGFVFQTPRLLDWRTVRHNVELLLEELELSKPDRRARVERYLELVGLDGYQDYFPHQISGGMQQRVAMARALAIHPSILVMDEPFSGLDAITAERMREELVRIWQETKKTVLFVTHDIGEAVFLSQRVFILTNQPARVHASVAVDGSRTNASSRKAKSSDVFFRNGRTDSLELESGAGAAPHVTVGVMFSWHASDSSEVSPCVQPRDWKTRPMKGDAPSYHDRRFPPEIISHASGALPPILHGLSRC